MTCQAYQNCFGCTCKWVLLQAYSKSVETRTKICKFQAQYFYQYVYWEPVILSLKRITEQFKAQQISSPTEKEWHYRRPSEINFWATFILSSSR